MKVIKHFAESAHIRSITAAAGKLIDQGVQQEIAILARFLSPQWHAGYLGLKKLIEKDYRSEEDDLHQLSVTNA